MRLRQLTGRRPQFAGANAIIQAALTGIRVKSSAALGAPDDKTGANAPAGQPHLNLQPTKLVTAYIRL